MADKKSEDKKPEKEKDKTGKSKYISKNYWIMFAVYLAIIEILLFTVLSPVKNLISTLIAYPLSKIAPGWIGPTNFLINAAAFVFGLAAAFLLSEWGLIKGGIVLVLIIVLLLFGPKLIQLIPSPGGQIGNFGSMLTCMLKESDVTKCVVSNTTTAAPEAKMIYQFQPIEIRFGSKYTPTPFTPPTLYANDKKYGYSLTITVTNPNTENELTVDGFYIKSYTTESGENGQADMIGNGYKIMCGNADKCNETNPCSLPPNSDTEISLNFADADKGTCKSASNLTTTISEDDCKDKNLENNGCVLVTNHKDPTDIQGCSKQSELCLKELCKEKCAEEYPCVNFADFVNKTNKKCVCVRDTNNFADLCCEDVFGTEAKIKFYAAHNFSVLGRGEFRIAATEQYENFEPTVLSSAGPLVATVYFEPHAILYNKIGEGTLILMRINLKNDGDGDVRINNISIEQTKDKIGFINDDINKDSIAKCIQDTKERIKSLNSGESQESVCMLGLEQGKPIEMFATIMMNAEMNYTYTWLNSKTLPITKFDSSKNPGLIGIMPGYCPTA